MVILSHTNPDYYLKEHLLHTRNIAMNLISKSQRASEYGLEKIVKIATETHDLGKATEWFQKYLRGERLDPEMKEHSFISACFAHFVAKKEELDTWQRVATYFIVAGHHGQLKHKKPSEDTDIEILQKQAENILENAEKFIDDAKRSIPAYSYVQKFLQVASAEPKSIIKNIRKDIRKLRTDAPKIDMYENVKRFLITKMAYSSLVSADTTSAALRTDKITEFLDVVLAEPVSLDEHTTKLPRQRKIDEIRSKIYEQVRSVDLKTKIYLLELPTGAGKTFTGLRTAMSTKRPIIYTLPYTSIIDQTVSILQKEDLYDGNVIPFHHLACGYKELEDKNKDENYDEYQRKLLDLLIEGWYAPIIVTTYEQVMYALTWNKKRFSQRVHAIGKSTVLLDEIQAIPSRIWDATWYVLKALNELFETPILVMSATVPTIPEHARDVVEELQVKIPDPKVFIRREFEYHPDVKSIDALSDLITQLKEKYDRVLCVVNTRCDAYKIYEKTKDAERPVILLSTYIPPVERLKRIRELKTLDKWIAISTQVIEAGVDIEADVLIRDIAPLDSIVQSAGRCNRNGEQKRGKVIIVELKDENGKLRAERVYHDKLLINTTRDILKKMPKGADDVFMENALKEYYTEVYLKKRKESEQGHESIPVEMGQMLFKKITDDFRLITEIPSLQIILADRRVLSIIDRIRQIKEQMKTEENYERKFLLLRNLQKERKALEQYIVAVYKPTNGESRAQRMLNYLAEKTRDALRRLDIYDDTFMLVLEELPEDLRKKTEEVGISWVCEGEEWEEGRFV